MQPRATEPAVPPSLGEQARLHQRERHLDAQLAERQAAEQERARWERSIDALHDTSPFAPVLAGETPGQAARATTELCRARAALASLSLEQAQRQAAAQQEREHQLCRWHAQDQAAERERDRSTGLQRET